jgi:hypothetical protein
MGHGHTQLKGPLSHVSVWWRYTQPKIPLYFQNHPYLQDCSYRVWIKFVLKTVITQNSVDRQKCTMFTPREKRPNILTKSDWKAARIRIQVITLSVPDFILEENILLNATISFECRHMEHSFLSVIFLNGQGRSVHVNRVSPANTLKKTKNKKVFCLTFVVQWYSIHWNTAQPIR